MESAKNRGNKIMRRSILYLSLLAAAFYPVAAHAATCDEDSCLLTITQVGNAANTFTFLLPGGNVTPVSTDGSTYFEITGITATGPDGYSSANDTLYFYAASPSYTGPDGSGSYTGGFWDGSLVDNNAQPGSEPWGFEVADATFFSGSVSSPSFDLTAMTSDGPLVNYWGDGTYNYSISEMPEPSSLILLGTGAMGLISAYRRRSHA